MMIIAGFLMTLTLFSKAFTYQGFQNFLPDGKYCRQELKNYQTKDHHQSCTDPIVIRTKYPYLIIWKENHDRGYDHGIHVVKPEFWHDVVDLKKSKSEELHFTVHNTSFHPHSHQPHYQHHNHSRQSIDFTLKLKDGLLLAQTVAYKRVQSPSTDQYCTMNNLVPGKWKYDPKLLFNTSEAWNTCPTINNENFEPRWRCSFHALQYFPDSNCHILPLRQSLFLLYHNFQIEGLITNASDKPYFFFMGDSLIIQLCVTVRCELHSHANMILSRPSYLYNASSLRSLGYQARYKWNQFLRSDLPCSRSCSDETYLRNEGVKGDYRHEISPCRGCPDGNLTHISASHHPELFYMLHEIPLSVRVLVLDAGAWFISDNVRGEDSNVVYKETLEALIPHLVYFQKQRNYEVDIYFLPLPGVDPSLAKSPSHEWPRYEEKNRIMYNLFSPQSLVAHNLTVTILPNNELFQRKHLIDGVTNVFLPDNLHYCAPGAFAPDSYLFELIVHNHVVKKLKQT